MAEVDESNKPGKGDADIVRCVFFLLNEDDLGAQRFFSFTKDNLNSLVKGLGNYMGSADCPWDRAFRLTPHDLKADQDDTGNPIHNSYYATLKVEFGECQIVATSFSGTNGCSLCHFT